MNEKSLDDVKKNLELLLNEGNSLLAQKPKTALEQIYELLNDYLLSQLFGFFTSSSSQTENVDKSSK